PPRTPSRSPSKSHSSHRTPANRRAANGAKASLSNRPRRRINVLRRGRFAMCWAGPARPSSLIGWAPGTKLRASEPGKPRGLSPVADLCEGIGPTLGGVLYRPAVAEDPDGAADEHLHPDANRSESGCICPGPCVMQVDDQQRYSGDERQEQP